MAILEARNVSIRYITGDFKDIGLKEYVMRRLTGNYHVTEFWADKDVSFTLEHGEMLGIIGFDGELTVKENAYLRGAMLGYTRKFMDEKYDEIIDFAELKDFEDRPFKQLSSGMKSRLAFSIACLVKPDILILDEVLSVGDGSFKKKSEAKMNEIISGGATTILVSHSLEQVRKMCTKVLWLHKGRQIDFGTDVFGICDRYQDFLDGKLGTV